MPWGGSVDPRFQVQDSWTKRKRWRGPWGLPPQPCRAEWGEGPEEMQAGQTDQPGIYVKINLNKYKVVGWAL